VTRHDAERKRKIMDVIAATIRARGYPPSVREIAKAVGLASTSAVHHHLQVLEKEGYLERGAAQSRAIRLTHGADVAGRSQPQSMPARRTSCRSSGIAGGPIEA
jgi:repressor LexA